MSGRKSKVRDPFARVTEAERQAMYWLSLTGKNFKDIGAFIGVSGGAVRDNILKVALANEEAPACRCQSESCAPAPAPALVELLLGVGG
jgi:hypothetical protein